MKKVYVNSFFFFFWAALCQFSLSPYWPFTEFQNQTHKWCFHSMLPPSYHVKYKRCPLWHSNFKPCLEIKHIKEQAYMFCHSALSQKSRETEFMAGEIYFPSLPVSAWCTLIQSQRGEVVELKRRSPRRIIKNWGRRRWWEENKGDEVKRREK